MIIISPEVVLQDIKTKDQQTLLKLMVKIYHPVYKHLWEDDGKWYVNSTFSLESLKSELKEENSNYYFVLYNSKKCGILRIQHKKTFLNSSEPNATKLHRIYILPEYQSKKIGQLLLDWTVKASIKNNSKILWLEAMDTQKQALNFYLKNGFSIYESFNLEFDLMYHELRGMRRMTKQLL